MRPKTEMTAMQKFLLLVAGCLTALPAAGGSDTAYMQPGNGLQESSDYQVTMTWVSGNRRFATIDGEFYSVGDELPDGARVQSIESGIVRVSRNGTTKIARIVDAPPSLASARKDEGPTLDSYLDNAVNELDRAASARVGDKTKLEELRALRGRLDAARNRLSNGEMSDEERENIQAEANEDWLLAQSKLDALRHRIVASGGGLDMQELRATQKLLEETMLSALQQPLGELQKQYSEAPEGEQPAGSLLDAVGDILTSYPDYQALADKLEQYQAEQKYQAESQ